MLYLKHIPLLLIALLLLFGFIRTIGRIYNHRVPRDGIQESMYIDVNGTKQWLQIYGKDRNNPVLLYLHGGPGEATSHYDFAFTRKWADVYTVVTWDQRNCGKSYDPKQNSTPLTRQLLMQDGKTVTEFVLQHLSKDRITVLGHSWGSVYGANLVLAYPQYYDCFIGAGQLVDAAENEMAFLEAARQWAEDDPEGMALVAQLTPEILTAQHLSARNALMRRYGYHMMSGGQDYSMSSAMLFNPYYSLRDWLRLGKINAGIYLDFVCSEEFRGFSLLGRTEYPVAYYNINGDRDYQTNYQLAQAYFNQINAPHKQLYLMQNMTHGLLESDSEGFSQILHQIAAAEAVRRQA